MLKRTVIALLTLATGAFAQDMGEGRTSTTQAKSAEKANGPPQTTDEASQADVNSIGVVVAIQRALTEYGYGQLKPTGTIGVDTVRAIQKFERDHKLPITGRPSTSLVKQLSTLVGRPLDYSEPQTRDYTEPPTSIGSPGTAPTVDERSALLTFAWPVRGKVTTPYGEKINGKTNDGINLAVPEGTPVKAAEDGVVAYAGNELRGYGNLILVRHSNGYVTAYAHASELLASRGDTVKRGQVIAKSGQSGEVASPQLHFEVRKGSSPVDPLQILKAP